MDPNNQFQPTNITPADPGFAPTGVQQPMQTIGAQQPQPIAPNQFGQVMPPVMPNSAAPAATPQPGAVVGGPAVKKKSKLLVVIVIALVLLLVMVGAVVVFAQKKPVKKQVTTTTKTEAKGPQPATALDVEQSNNAINQDVSGLDDDKDFPVDELSDKLLGL